MTLSTSSLSVGNAAGGGLKEADMAQSGLEMGNNNGQSRLSPMRQRGESDCPPCIPHRLLRLRLPATPLRLGHAARLLPYLWQYKWRVVAAIAFMVGAKLANVGVPLLLKTLVDAMSVKPGDPAAVLVVPVGLLLAYGALRLSTSLFTELRELVFAKATQGAARSIALQTFEHLHA
jgi:hypothetical protein